MSSQFLYFLAIPGNEPLLKEEIRLHFPNFKFAYSRPGFCTFKNTGEILTLDDIANLPIIFSLTYGETYKRIKLDEIHCHITKRENSNINLFQLEGLEEDSSWMSLDKPSIESEIQWDFIRTTKDEVFLGHRKQDPFSSPFLRKFHPHREDLISRAYYKGADAFSLMKIQAPCRVLELGCVPGGTSQFLLESNFQVVGVDPGMVDSKVLENPQFDFLQTGVHDLRVDRKWGRDIQVLISDINLSPKIVLKECVRLSKDLPNLKHVFITCKMNKEAMLKDLGDYKKLMKKMGCKDITFLQLPYHRKEFLAYGKR